MPQSAKVVPLLSPMPAAVWPIPGDAPDLDTVVQDQAVTVAAQNTLIQAYQNWLNQQQQAPAPRPAAYGNGTSSGTPATTLTVSAVTGVITVPSRVAGPGITVVPTNIIAQQSGTAGGAGVYTTDQPMTASSAALTFTPPPQPSPWPTPTDAPTLTAIQQAQTAILRTQTALIQQYQDLLNTSQTPAPPTGP
jgi:hypothetical protein